MRNSLFPFVLLSLGLSGAAQAALIDRGGGLLYDDVLNVTWLQDANYAKTSGYDADGRMNWSAAQTWAANLVYGGYDDWRLATNTPVGGAWNILATNDGSTDRGYNITGLYSELGYMYYVNLGLLGAYSPTGDFQPGHGIFGNGTWGGQADVGLIRNLDSSAYWSEAVYVQSPFGYSWAFSTFEGSQGAYDERLEMSAWAVRPGDIRVAGGGGDALPIPEPETYAIVLAGLALLAVSRVSRRGASTGSRGSR